MGYTVPCKINGIYCDLQNKISTVFNGYLYQFTSATPSGRLPFILQIAIYICIYIQVYIRKTYIHTHTRSICANIRQGAGGLCNQKKICAYAYTCYMRKHTAGSWRYVQSRKIYAYAYTCYMRKHTVGSWRYVQ